MKFKMFEVNFGESILYYDEKNPEEKLLVDCGAKFGAGGWIAANRVIGSLTCGKDSLLITHFDVDHYNGISEIHNWCKDFKFRKIYLPRYIYRDKGVYDTDIFFRDTIMYYAYLKLIGKPYRL
ncbi:hypothetical protein, partial [Butyrivibrio sp. AD3002]|uniref:hypothetical protein n=1 Tax=Butyrivibrio sp. AD3002 TaxID=1280670 RepID=UPI0005D1CE41